MKYTLRNFMIGTGMVLLLFGLVILSIQALANQPTNTTEQELDIFYMYGNKGGSYFLEPQAEYENLIYINQSDLNDWDITPTEPGQRFTGTFDPTGWELLNLKHKEENK